MKENLVLFGSEVPTVVVYALQILLFLFVSLIGISVLNLIGSLVGIVVARKEWMLEHLEAIRNGYKEGVVGIDAYIHAFNKRIPIAAPLIQKAADSINVDDPNTKQNKAILAWINTVLPDIDLDGDGKSDTDITPDELLKALKYLKQSLEEFADDDVVQGDAVLVPELFATLIERLSGKPDSGNIGAAG